MFSLFGDPQHSVTDQVLRAYEHRDAWVNRMILGDSLVVMNSLLEYEGLGGQVQMIYMDPPYGVKFGSNFQSFVRKRDARNDDDADLTREGEAPEVPVYEENRPPGTTAEVDFWTSREPCEVVRSHVNYVVPDTERWEQSAAYILDSHDRVDAFVKNSSLGFAIPYLHNGQDHECLPDFIVRLKSAAPRHRILEVKGWDERAAIKAAAAQRWLAAVNADGQYGALAYAVAYAPNEVRGILESV